MSVHKVVQRAWGTAAEIAAYLVPAREIVVNTDDYSLVVGDGSTTGGRVRIVGTPAGAGYTRSAPTTGATITAAAGERRRIIDPAGTLATLTVTLPPSPVDGDVWEGMTSQALTALTVNAPGGASVNGGSFLAPANSGFSWVYRSGNITWYRRH